MKKSLTGTTCLSRSNDGKQNRWGRSLQRLATFAILFLCSWTVSWAQGTTTGNNGKVTLKDATAPTIKLNSAATTTTQLSFTITETAEAQEGTHLETYYYIPGPDDDSEENNPNRVKLTGSSQTVTLDWVTDAHIEVRAFTKRVDDSNPTNYDDSKVTWQVFYNTGSTVLPCLDEPVITPGDQAVFAKEFTVTIDQDQWKADLSIKPQIYYMIEEINDDGTRTTKEWTEATSLPLTLTLTKSSTVKASALFEGASTEVSRTYFLLDETTTYVNKENTQDVGTIVEKNGMTMTYGGIQKEGSYFTKFSNIDNSEDNILGSLHTVTGTPLYLNLDAMSEKGVVSEKGSLYSHQKTSDQALHERTFSLPAMGSFFKFEPVANGELTVFVEQQGAMVKSKGNLDPAKIRKRIVYFLDETGTSIPATYAYTSSKINKSDWTSVKNSAVENNDAYMTKLKAFYQSIIDGSWTFPNINSAFSKDSREFGMVLGESIQPIIVLHDEANADILEGDNNYDKTGYMLISEGYVTYSFPVKAGKTYYLFASGTKLALSGFSFDQDAANTPAEVTLDAKANNADKIKGLPTDQLYNVTLNNRTFRTGRWYTMVLPFSVSQKQMKDVFGNEVKILHYNNVEGTNLNLFEHFYQMVVGGTPVLVKPSQDVVNPTFNNVTLTSQVVVDIVNSGYKCTGSYDDKDFPEYSYFIDARTNTFYQYDPTQKKENTVVPHAGAFRAWFIADGDPSAASQLTMHINGVEDSSETTAIWNALSADDNRTEMGSKDIYSLSGQKMNVSDMRSLPKGIYIVNGKKYIVK